MPRRTNYSPVRGLRPAGAFAFLGYWVNIKSFKQIAKPPAKALDLIFLGNTLA